MSVLYEEDLSIEDLSLYLSYTSLNVYYSASSERLNYYYLYITSISSLSYNTTSRSPFYVSKF